MKKLFVVLVSLLVTDFLVSAPPVAEAPIKSVGTPVTISISSSTLTKVPSSQTSGRIGLFFDNPSSNGYRVVGHLGNCTSTALASTIRPVEITTQTNTSYFPIREDVCLWLITLNPSASESIHYQEVMQ